MMSFKVLASALAMIITFSAFLPYIRGILTGAIKAHVFSWVIWGITTLVVFFAQLSDNGGAGAWAVGLSAGITLFIACLAFLKRGDLAITKLDWLFFIAALSSLPFWYFSDSALMAVIILTTVDLLGFGPTLRKAWAQPQSESLGFFALFLLRNLLVVAALEYYSWVTLLFPLAVALACMALMLIIVLRRRQLSRTTPAGF
jgi:hypothetical protein